MKVVVALFLFLLLLKSLDSRVSPKVVPNRSQFFKYENFSVSCEQEEQEEEQEEQEVEEEVEEEGWRVKKRMVDGEVHQGSSSCHVMAAFPVTDSGVYWCETGHGETSDTVNITVTDGSVILKSPALPVMEGDSVTLSCTSQTVMSAGDFTADFYKDGDLIETSSTQNMVLHDVSRSDEGLYMCRVGGFRESPESWLTVRAPPADLQPPAPSLSVFTLVRHLVVGTPYLLSTVLLALIYRDRARAQHARRARQTSHDVIMEMSA